MEKIGIRIAALVLLIGGVLLGWFIVTSAENKPFQLGLDLSGGTHLEYKALIDEVPEAEREEAMESLRDVIERRVNLFGVSEPNVQTETARLGQDEKQYRLVVELPGVTDVEEAIAMIGQTPLLEFKEQNPALSDTEFEAALQSETIKLLQDQLPPELSATLDAENPEPFVTTELTGAYLARARLEFQQTGTGTALATGTPIIALEFTKEGALLFEQITERNVGKIVAIYLDGAPISTPVVQQKITGGEAVITGAFTLDESKKLVGRLNSGALPVPVELLASQTIGASLGSDAVQAGIQAGIYGFLLISIFLVLYYRLPGLVAVVALGMYGVVTLALFKLVPVTLTAAGIAGFIISVGIAVDANILIFERMKEELKDGRGAYDALRVGFDRAWLSIRDGNISSIISAVVLFWFGT
ncbi:MAG: protein translocase subunit SecD, partial [Candidatus Pacebacteria bacterium]|nr:protein translocase subunit SecD [Candidatus Paceibacterota bacterium]